jgi:hypothetical protein
MTSLTYVTAARGEAYKPYLFAFLQSIVDVHGADQEIASHVWHSDLTDDDLTTVTRKSPRTTLKPCENPGAPSGTAAAERKLEIWSLALEAIAEGENVALLDCDTVLLRDLRPFLDDPALDVCFSYKTHADENLDWPLNTGVVLVRNGPRARDFLRWWDEETQRVAADPEEAARLRRDWGACDQATLGVLLGTREIADYAKPIERMGLTFRGATCEELNETRCCAVTERTHLIHYKGKWWRQMLRKPRWWRHHILDLKLPAFKKIRSSKCREMFMIWTDKIQRWEAR